MNSYLARLERNAAIQEAIEDAAWASVAAEDSAPRNPTSGKRKLQRLAASVEENPHPPKRARNRSTHSGDEGDGGEAEQQAPAAPENVAVPDDSEMPAAEDIEAAVEPEPEPEQEAAVESEAPPAAEAGDADAASDDEMGRRRDDSDDEAAAPLQSDLMGDDDAPNEIQRIFGRLMSNGVRSHHEAQQWKAAAGEGKEEKKSEGKKKKPKPPGFPLYRIDWSDTKAPPEEPTTDCTWCFLCECSKGTFEMNKNEWYQDMLKYIDDNAHKVRPTLLAYKVQSEYYDKHLRNTIEDPSMRMPWYRDVILDHIWNHAPSVRFQLEQANRDFLQIKKFLMQSARYFHPETGAPQPDLKVMAEYRHSHKAHMETLTKLAPMRQENVL